MVLSLSYGTIIDEAVGVTGTSILMLVTSLLVHLYYRQEVRSHYQVSVVCVHYKSLVPETLTSAKIYLAALHKVKLIYILDRSNKKGKEKRRVIQLIYKDRSFHKIIVELKL